MRNNKRRGLREFRDDSSGTTADSPGVAADFAGKAPDFAGMAADSKGKIESAGYVSKTDFNAFALK